MHLAVRLEETTGAKVVAQEPICVTNSRTMVQGGRPLTKGVLYS